MALIDYEVHNNEVQQRNALVQEARSLLLKAKEAAKDGSDWKERPDLSKAITAFLNDSRHEKYEYTEPEKKF